MPDTKTVIDLHPYGRGPSPASLDGPVVGIEQDQGMGRATSLIEEAFRVSQAHALGAFFDALVEDCVILGEGAGPGGERALRVMAKALERVKAARPPATKLYTSTPVPGTL